VDIEARGGLRPRDDDDTPNDNPPGVPPASVAKPDYTPGDPEGLVLVDEGPGARRPRSLLHASPWDGWPADWNLPLMGRTSELTDTAWAALDLNSSVFASMPPYMVGASPNLPDEWIDNPDPDRYESWADFAHALMWDFQMGEVFVLCTARYGNGWPARFHVVPPWLMTVDLLGDGRRSYTIGYTRIAPGDVLHIRYRSTVDNARGTGPLDAGRSRMLAATVLLRYMTEFIRGGAVPSGVLESEEELSAKQAGDLHDQWIEARMSRLGLPAVLSGGVTWKPTQINALDTALADLAGYNESKIAVLLGVPPFLLGLPSGGDSMTYSNVSSVFDYHWRGGLRPKAQRVMLALSQWLVPRGTGLEVNRDEYVKPGPLERAQTWEIYLRNGVVDAEAVQVAERFTTASVTTSTPISGVLK
jgi:HK97 family phage portal protein